MITEQEFHDRVVNVAGVADSMTVEEFNAAIMDLCEKVLARRSREKMTAAVAHAHRNGFHCGRAFCAVCNPGVE